MTASSSDFDGREFARRLPEAPGVYRMYDAGGTLLYVGKAKNLRSRVSSYFTSSNPESRTRWVERVARLETTVVPTESDALLLEAELIQRERPRYNVLLREGTLRSYLELSDDPWPRLSTVRARGASAPRPNRFGPFSSNTELEDTLRLTQKAFRLRSCPNSVFAHRSRPCLQHSIGRCSAPCVRLIERDDYAQSVQEARSFLSGQHLAVSERLRLLMEAASQAHRFEEAARWRDRLAQMHEATPRPSVLLAGSDVDAVAVATQEGVTAVTVATFREGMSRGTQTFFPEFPKEAAMEPLLLLFLMQYYLETPPPPSVLVPDDLIHSDQNLLAVALSQRSGRAVSVKPARSRNRRFMDLAQRNAEASLDSHLAKRSLQVERRRDLQKILDLPRPPELMECFDISHLQGEAAMASCVVFGANGPVKNAYRHYALTGITPGDDYAGMEHVLRRRFGRLVRGEGARPDVVFIDGGLGQVTRAVTVLNELGLSDLPVVGVAKGPQRRAGRETLILGTHKGVLRPGPESPALHLIQSIRDEAHRFAVFGHRRRRDASRQVSVLEGIPGVGPRRRTALLKALGGMDGVAASTPEELQKVPGIPRALAQRIHAAFHPSPADG